MVASMCTRASSGLWVGLGLGVGVGVGVGVGAGAGAAARAGSGGDGEASAAAFAAPWRFSTGLHCPDCDISYKDPSPSTFSFNSPIGACETCRGFGRSSGVVYGLVIPEAALSLRQGATRPGQTESYKKYQADLLKFARKRD